MKINEIIARQILDSRGIPTVEAEVWLENGIFGRASVPSGASTGKYEAHELRDGGKAYNGNGVSTAVHNIQNTISPALKGKSANDQSDIDKIMIDLDGTENKSKLGANAILAVSLATAHAAARAQDILLYSHINNLAGMPTKSVPMPMFNVLNGGKHATNSSDFQEFMLVPITANTYSQGVKICDEIFHTLKRLITEQGVSTAVGDEGGFTYPVAYNSQMLDILSHACKEAGYEPGRDVVFALDIAASELFENGKYFLKIENRHLSSDELTDYYEKLKAKYPIVSIEDPLEQDQWQNWSALKTKLTNIQIVGDDLLVTNIKRLQKAIDQKASNAILIKPNQIGTLSETLDAINLAKRNGFNTIISHRSGETEDVTIAHIAIGTGAGQIKTGSLSRSERTSKHNEIMRLESIDESIALTNPFENLSS